MIDRRRCKIVVGLLCVPAVLFGAGYGAGFRINLTPSYPLGLWRIVPLDRAVCLGDRIFICAPPTAMFRQARDRGYLRHGLCPGSFSPLIKTVVALPGQLIDVGPSVIIDGHELPHSAVQPFDGSGRPLAAFTGGIVPAGMLLLHSPYRGSYDSRYFGPVPTTGVLGLTEPVVTFGP